MVHGGCLLFASSAAFLASDGVDRKVACGLMEPSRERGTLLQLYRMLRQREEHTLRHILGQVRVTDDPQGHRVDEVNMAMHQLAK